MKIKIIITLSAVSIWFLAYFLIQNNFICFDKVCENNKKINSLNFEIIEIEKSIFENEQEKIKAQSEVDRLSVVISDFEYKKEEITNKKIELFWENKKIITEKKEEVLEKFVPPEQTGNFAIEKMK